MLFSWYAANFADYNETYGSLGAAVALMTWLWLTVCVVLIGAAVTTSARPTALAWRGLPHVCR